MSKSGEQVGQVAQVEQPGFEVDDKTWDFLVRACGSAYQELRRNREYVDDLDEYAVRVEAIDGVLRETQASKDWKAWAKEQLLKESFVKLAD